MALTGFDGFHLVDLPDGGVWRVTNWADPLDPPPPPPPLDTAAAQEDDGGRWDDPDGIFRTLYCATTAEGAVGEKLGPFALNPDAVLRIEEFFDSEPDEEFASDDLAGALTAEEIEALDWTLAWAPTHDGALAIDVGHPRTMVAALPGLAPLLKHYAIPSFDRAALLDTRRNFTRRVAGYLRKQSTDDDERLRANGLQYESRLPPAWECWALWEPLPLETDEAEITDVTISTPDLRNAAGKLGVPIETVRSR